MAEVLEFSTATKRELTSKFTQYKMDKWESNMRKLGEDTCVLELTGLGELIQAILSGTSASGMSIDPKILRILSTNRMITLIELGNASYTREDATARLEKYLEDEDNSIITAYFDLLLEVDMDLKLFATFGLNVRDIKNMFKKMKHGMGSLIKNSAAFKETLADEEQSQNADTDNAEVDTENNTEETVNTEVNNFGI